MKGLYTRTALKENPSEYGSNPELQEMLEQFWENKTQPNLEDKMMQDMLNTETW